MDVCVVAPFFFNARLAATFLFKRRAASAYPASPGMSMSEEQWRWEEEWRRRQDDERRWHEEVPDGRTDGRTDGADG